MAATIDATARDDAVRRMALSDRRHGRVDITAGDIDQRCGPQVKKCSRVEWIEGTNIVCPIMMSVVVIRMIPPLADGSSVASVIGWSLALIALLVIGFLAVSRVRSWLTEEDLPSGGAGFSLSDLRQLRKEGKISEEEYEHAHAKMVGAAREMTQKLPSPLGGRTVGPIMTVGLNREANNRCINKSPPDGAVGTIEFSCQFCSGLSGSILRCGFTGDLRRLADQVATGGCSIAVRRRQRQRTAQKGAVLYCARRGCESPAIALLLMRRFRWRIPIVQATAVDPAEFNLPRAAGRAVDWAVAVDRAAEAAAESRRADFAVDA